MRWYTHLVHVQRDELEDFALSSELELDAAGRAITRRIKISVLRVHHRGRRVVRGTSVDSPLLTGARRNTAQTA